ncbi:MAG: RpiB/LacA/LacB family sugar-phosphate isomerase [Deltaproteobacteria bacterium]|nr:RpiB/LacA/LacB family sugar-phosphate isomerase [Deltaproteobacteria bacterium]
MKIAIGNDHRGLHLKKKILQKFSHITFINVGSDSEERVDYPDYAKEVAQKVSQRECDLGILICGSGVGMSIAANKFPGIRASLVWDTKVAALTRQQAFDIVQTWLETSFEGGRHEVRLKKIQAIERELKGKK